MPKLVDNYVIEQKIGSGQFGDVYKGFDQTTQVEVAIKAIRRQTIKGKFYQLLENQIKVLKSCDNQNIIKLYSIKKTANHFYLMLEYCNQGDMFAYIKKHPKIPEEEVIRFFCQILNGFQTLVKNRIIHRDFKLANILLHNGSIKIADFGFAKLLASEDYTSTMLGSPLNMAPQVIGGNKYNSKADIWSIGACIFEILTGKPPFVASNMVDLLKLIKSKPVNYPKCSQVLLDALKKMLVVDPKRRIGWNELFNHPINSYLSQKLQKQIDLQLIEDESLMLNTSKYYLKKNLVIDRPEDIKNNNDVNSYLYKLIHQEKKSEFSKDGTGNNFQKSKEIKTQTNSHLNYTSRQKSKIYRQNSKKILYYRNIYAFLATVADEVIRNSDIKYHELAAYVLTQKIVKMITWLRNLTHSKQCRMEGLEDWQAYLQQPEFQEIKKYIEKQYEVFQVFSHTLQPIIKTNILKSVYHNDVSELLIQGFKDQTYKKYIYQYCRSLINLTTLTMLKTKQTDDYKQIWKHIEQSLLARNVDEIFSNSNFEYDFKTFYEKYNFYTLQQLLLKVQQLLLKS